MDNIKTWQERTGNHPDATGEGNIETAMCAEITDLRAALARAGSEAPAGQQAEPVAVVVENIEGLSIIDKLLPPATRLYFAPVVAAPAAPTEHHPDDEAVRRFAAAMIRKMYASRQKGRYGWNEETICPTERLQSMLLDHLAKGDPVDVANFCMMLWTRGAPVAAPAAPTALHLIEDLAKFSGAGGMAAVNELVGRAQSILAAPAAAQKEPSGYKLVPIEPTPEMVRATASCLNDEQCDNNWQCYDEAGNVKCRSCVDQAAEQYRMALAAAPIPQKEGAVEVDAKDAARYRWLRDKSEPGIFCTFYLSVGQAFKNVKFARETVDEAIDAQIAATPEQKG